MSQCDEKEHILRQKETTTQQQPLRHSAEAEAANQFNIQKNCWWGQQDTTIKMACGKATTLELVWEEAQCADVKLLKCRMRGGGGSRNNANDNTRRNHLDRSDIVIDVSL